MRISNKYCNPNLVVNKMSYEVLKHETFLIYKGTEAVHIQGIGRLVLCGNKVLQQLAQATFLCAPEKILRKKNHK